MMAAEISYNFERNNAVVEEVTLTDDCANYKWEDNRHSLILSCPVINCKADYDVYHLKYQSDS